MRLVVNNAFGANAEAGLDGPLQIEAAEQSLFELRRGRRRTTGGFVTFERALTDAILGAERAFRRSGSGVGAVLTGLRDLDSKMGGMHPSDLLILAGRPGMGKTALGDQDRLWRSEGTALADARAADSNRARQSRASPSFRWK